MNKFLIGTLTFTFFLSVNLAFTKAESKKDRAAFRFDSTVFFLSEVNEGLKNIERYRCLKKWKSLELSNLDKKNYSTFPKIDQSDKSMIENKGLILRFIDLQKMKVFTKEQLVKVDLEELNKLNKKKCFKGSFSNWPKSIQELAKLDYYIDSRYIRNSKDDQEINYRVKSFYSSIIKKSTEVLFF